MNNIERIFSLSNNFEHFAGSYFAYLYKLLTKLDVKAINDLVNELESAYEKDNTVFIIGNGGSAATASHMANDIGVDVFKKSKSVKAFRISSLTDNNSVMTAIANDSGYENLFVNQLEIHYRLQDKLIAISASGNSPNIIKAVEWVKQKNGITIGLSGFNGGKLKDICDIAINVETPKGEYGPVEDIHLILDHLIALWLQYKYQKIISEKGVQI